MKIIAGRLKGRRLAAPPGEKIRPTSGKLRERLFNMLEHGPYPRLPGARAADIFAGTGALGFEALSRGASHVVFVEKSPDAARLIEENRKNLGAEKDTALLRCAASDLPEMDIPFDIVFMDPPYRQGLAEAALLDLLRKGWLKPESVVAVEESRKARITIPEGYRLLDRREAAISQLLFLGMGPGKDRDILTGGRTGVRYLPSRER